MHTANQNTSDMKKQIVFILAAFISVLSVSCTKDDDREITPDTPDVSETQFLPVSDTRITVGPEAGTHVIKYEIVEPTGASVTAEAASGTDWMRMERSISPCPSTVAMSPELRILF